MTGCCQVTTTLPDRESAQRMAAELVGARLAACGQVQGPIDSTYWWEDQVASAAEWYCHFKTTLSRLPALRMRLREVHPYEVPEIIAVPIVDGDPAYLRWVEESVSNPSTTG
jgi:periplasmic divalent cation tolerance protein